MTTNRRRPTSNSIEINFLARCLVLFSLIGIGGMFFVYLKNQQHEVGNQMRLVEERLKEAEAMNETFSAKVNSLTSRVVLQRRLEEKYLHLEEISDSSIVRLTPDILENHNRVLFAVSHDSGNHLGVDDPQPEIIR